ncbi:MAG: ATP cone domain-containing protein [Clostridia bacterium]
MIENAGSQVFIVKRSGEREPFSEAKLRRSLEKALASPDMIDNIVRHIQGELKEGMTTSEIYRQAFSLLKKYHFPIAARYSLKQAIMDLGPEGHFFEKFVGELVKSKGFTVEVGKVVEGFCVEHEVDVVGKKNDYHIMVECKFHNSLGIKSDVKVALYVQARFEDIERKWRAQPGHGHKFHEAWLVTNTKLTSDAIRYAACVDMKTIGWSYPEKHSLQSLTEQSGLHPLTCLTSLNNSQKRHLLNQGAILCRDLVRKVDLLRSAGVVPVDIPKVAKEIGELCQIPNLDML